jgi:hypothetical protein
MRETHSMLLPRMATSRPLSPFNFETSLMGPDSDGEKVILCDQLLGAEHMAAPTNAAFVKITLANRWHQWRSPRL